jgi:hemoglobin
MALPPLETRAQLDLLLARFYERVRQDALIGPVFDQVAQVNWEEHLPKIGNFWEQLLFDGKSYRGRPFPPHVPLDLEAKHFERWLSLFFLTVDELHSGFKAEELKSRAYNIGRTFYSNLLALRANGQVQGPSL